MFFPSQSGMVNEEQATLFLVNDGHVAAIIGGMFVKNPGMVWQFILDLGAEINVVDQIEWPTRGRMGPVEAST